MLQKVDLTKTMEKQEYKQQTEPLRERLSVLQHEVKQEKLPIIVLFEGWGASGKGGVLSDVILTLDPRNFTAKSTLPPTAEEKRKPFLWRHWRSIPEDGYFAIFDRSWYPETSFERLEAGLTDKEAHRRMRSVNLFERQLVNNGTLVVKFFLHISQKEQKRRFDKLAAKKSTAWRVNSNDYKRNRHYEKYYRLFQDMLRRTNTEHAPWHIIPGTDRRYALAEIYKILVSSIEQALTEKRKAASAAIKSEDTPLEAGDYTLVQMPTLNEISLNVQVPRPEYKNELKKLHKKLAKLHNAVYLRKIPLVIVYEGWDAAGKGGNIKRLTEALDPRGYEVVPIASPTPPEKARQYLWRFWEQLPKNGHITLFDRSWYGRVMVERIEGFATQEEWRRAYREINEFEAELKSWGAIILKFWLHINKDEQLRRFEARQNTPEKRWKITEEDWRNREKWDQYEVAVNDMLRLTSTDFAPWTIIESQDKRFGRLKALHTVVEAIEAGL